MVATIKVLYEDNHVLCLAKPVNMPIMPDASGDMDLLTMAKAWLKEKYGKPGNVYLGLVHRLDRPVGGAVVFAKTSKAASRLSDAVRKQLLAKTYLAIIEGSMKQKEGTLVDYLAKDEKTNTSHVVDENHGKKCILHYAVLGERNGLSLVKIRLVTGRSHQIRVQFASRGLPLLHDQRYNKNATKGQIALHASMLSFPHPTTRQQIVVCDLPRHEGAWSLFENKLYDTAKETEHA